MASEAVSNGTSSEGLTPAQKLMEQHGHNPTVEEVPDEEDILHPASSASIKSPEPGEGLSEKAAGKQKADDAPAPTKKPTVPFNTASEELFPALGPAKPRAAAVAPTWGKKSTAPVNGGANGTSMSNTNSHTSTPASIPAALNLPGKDSDQLHFYPSELIPVRQLKKPLKDILQDINKRSKAKVEYKPGGPNGLITFTATGPKDAVHQALKDVANEVAAKVCSLVKLDYTKGLLRYTC
jgi:hypothetical protein